MNDDELVLFSLERAGELAGDVAPDVYRLWYIRCPAARGVMAHVDQYMQGRMLAEVLRLVLTPALGDERSYLRFETHSHAAYGVAPEMYPPLLAALRDTVAEVLGDGWTSAIEAAWQRRIDALLTEIVAAC